jgi:hypothetical protein
VTSVCLVWQRLGLPTSQEAEADAILQKAMYAPGTSPLALFIHQNTVSVIAYGFHLVDV